MLYGLDLFSGIGGLTIALQEWVRPLAYCEIESYCQSVLLQRMQAQDLPRAPIWDDIRTLSASQLPAVDIIYGGFPCQDISIAKSGFRKGLEGERSGLFYEMLRLSEEIKPQFLFFENVSAITNKGGLSIVKEIAEMGYDCRWCIISAASVGAPHKRERWFLLANSRRKQERSEEKPEWPPIYITRCGGKWETKSCLDRVANGVPFRMDRIKALGNSVVPLQAQKAFKILIGFENL